MLFQKEIITWYLNNKRDLPWRKTKDPYIIWLSEIILQQTRVEQGLPYFYKFLEEFPTIKDFANAKEETILKLWQGLGYYSRARNMLVTALHIMQHHKGIFPHQYKELIKLKGIGKYTAAAISSFSSNEVQAVIDGNVYRLLSRYFGISTPIDSTKGQKEFENLAKKLIDNQNAALYNQAIMEFGAIQCKPKSPDCAICPIRTDCVAYNNDLVNLLPVKSKKINIKKRYFNYLIITNKDQILSHKRPKGDIWQHLYEFPMIETSTSFEENNLELISKIKTAYGINVTIRLLKRVKHQLTHQILDVYFFGLDNYIPIFKESSKLKWVEISQFKTFPHPKIIGDYIEEYLN